MKERFLPKEALHIESSKKGNYIVFANDPVEAQKRAENRERTAKNLNGSGYGWIGKGGGRHHVK